MPAKGKSKGKAARDKGKRGERWVANYLKERGFDARRGIQFKGGLNSPDVICDDLPFNLEVKFVEKLNIEDAFAQSKRDAGNLKIPLVINKRSHLDAKVTIRLSDFVDILQIAHNRVDGMNDYIQRIGRTDERDCSVKLGKDSDYL